MSKYSLKSFVFKGVVAVSFLAASSITVSAQNAQSTTLKRKVQPISYWVNASSLKFRDNPVAGTVKGRLEYGQKVMAYSQYENWVRISKPGQDEQWVNSDFLSNSRLSWASYNRTASRRSSDVVSVRIIDPSDRKNRMSAVRVKTSELGNTLITTRHESGQGVYFQNRFVSCENNQPIGVRLVGEGTSFLGAQDDVRNIALDIYSSEKIDDTARNEVESAISEFACKVRDF